jgi:hypothetical protein
MREQDYVDRTKLSPARTFKSPMDVVQANDLGPAEKLAILKAWEVDERALLRAEDEGRACTSSQGASGPRPSQARAFLGRCTGAHARAVLLSVGRSITYTNASPNSSTSLKSTPQRPGLPSFPCALTSVGE